MAHSFLLLLVMVAVAGGRPKCGGVYTAARGILQTPGFPDTLPVPLQCEWVIDAQNLASPNSSIVVYLTQLYVHEGLTFTEYQVYDRTYQLDGRVVHTVNETNVVQVRWVQSFQDFLVVTLKLDTIDSAHLRVLDRFLDVYGFNITYEITRNPVRADACSMMDCGFTGTCFDHYTRFSCDCFPGYIGPQCSSGPRSFCVTGGNPTCKNGGTCVHVGASAVKCYCQKEFTGDTCQVPISSITKSVCENCITSCPFDGNLANACNCGDNNKNYSDRFGFTCTMHLANLPNLSGEAMKGFIENQIFRTLKVNYSKMDDVAVENVAHFRSGADVTFHLFAPKKDEKRLRWIFTRWADRGYIANLTVADKEFVLRPLLDLQSVSINQMGVIRQQDEFILSCVARGSPSMSFRWFKDGVFVNVTETTSHKWSRLIKDPHLEDQYTALLGVERSDALDAGSFSCQVEDFSIQQCLSRRIFIRTAPVIKIEPMSLTVRKGENLTINCISTSDGISKYTYSWTKNKELLPVRTDSEKYEILYPGGSILQIFGVEKSVRYSCLVQDDAASSEVTVDIHVVNPDLIRTCPPQTHLNVSWPETAPDTDSLQECPKGYAFPGFVRRSCTLKDGLRPVWLQPDYSRCTSEKLHKIHVDFQMLRLGYETTTPSKILSGSLRYLASRSPHGLYPGEGTRILLLVRDVISYTKQFHHSPPNITTAVFDVVDRILMCANSLIDQEQVNLLQEVVNHQVGASSSLVSKSQPLFHLSLATIDVSLMVVENNGELLFLPSNKSRELYWIPQKARINVKMKLKGKTNPKKQFSSILAVVIYRNLTAFLPTRSVIRLKDGAEVEYEIISQIVRIWIVSQDQSQDFHNSHVVLDWKRDLSENGTRDGWYVKCAMAETASYAYSWNTSACSTRTINSSSTRCACPTVGTVALLLTTNPVQVEQEENHPQRYVVLAGCSLCLLSALTCTIVLTTHWILKHSCVVFLKLQCCLSVMGVMISFILATVGDPPEKMFANVLAFIEILLLMGMSAHVSTLLVVYAEIVQLPKPATSKQTVIGISTGVPVIAVFGNHLAHRTMDVRLKSWWLLVGTLAFNIFITVTSVIVALFLFLHFTVVGKLQKLKSVHEKEAKVLQERLTLLQRSICIFGSLVAATASSIFYINSLDVIWWHYTFCATTMILGLTLVLCYIAKSETEFHDFFRSNLKAKQKEGFYGVESTGSPLNFFTKEEAEVESECMPQHNGSKSTTECFPMTDACKSGLPECVSGAMESYVHNESVYYERTTLRNESLERYNRSPQLYRKSTSFKIEDGSTSTETRCRSPDIIASKICTQLDLVASHAPSIIITPEESINQILTINSSEWTPQRTQPERKDIVTVSEKIDNGKIELDTASMPQPNVDNLDGMLDRISHDLDYLLNRSDEQCTNPAPVVNVRKISKPPAPSVIEEIKEEEEEVKVPEAITDILRTSC